jgi:ATP-dependent Clp protease ATP-binding subunit ClpA
VFYLYQDWDIMTTVIEFKEIVKNLFWFLPYLFSVKLNLRTFFYPWKNLIKIKPNTGGFSFAELGERLSFNIISRFIGAMMRFFLLLAFVFALIFSIITIPVFYLIYIIFSFFQVNSRKEEEIRRRKFKRRFIKTHCSKEENEIEVRSFLNSYFYKIDYQRMWWKKDNLDKIPPLAHDWARGYTLLLSQCSVEIRTYNREIDKRVIGHDEEMESIEQILSMDREANVLLIGKEDINKKDLLLFLADKIYRGQAKESLNYKKILQLNMEVILNKYTDHKKRELLFEKLLTEAINSKNVILFIDNLDRYVSSENNMVDLSLPLRKLGKHHDLQIIATTSPYSFQKSIFPNEFVKNIFVPININEISKKHMMELLLHEWFAYEERYSLTINYGILKYIIEKSDFYLTETTFPEKAFRLLDRVCVYARKKNFDFVSFDDVNHVLEDMTNAPVTLTSDIKNKLLSLESDLKEKVLFQEKAIEKIASAMRRSFFLLGRRTKPLASFLFLGPTGVGKTYTAKIIAKNFFGSEKFLTRFDMALYQNQDSVKDLVGSSLDNEPGLLSAAIRANPYGVLLLDEIEKAHKDLNNIFLTLLDEGYFTDGYGKRIDCKNLLVVATSNAAADLIYKKVDSKELIDDNYILSYLIEKRIFLPEFVNRFDGMMIFESLDNDKIVEIATLMLKGIKEDIKKIYKLDVEVRPTTLIRIVKNKYNMVFGARNMERLLAEEIQDKVAKLVLSDKTKEGDKIII